MKIMEDYTTEYPLEVYTDEGTITTNIKMPLDDALDCSLHYLRINR